MTYTVSEFLDGKVTLFGGDNRVVLIDAPDDSVDSIVTDPPYALVSIVKRFGGENAKPAKGNDAYTRASSGFMGRNWDTGEVAFSEVFWKECLRVLKPGGHVTSFGGTRTYHRMTCAIEDAGFEIRDTITWNFGSGFPKSHNIGKKLDESKSRCSCDTLQNVREVSSQGTIKDSKEHGNVLQLLVSEQDVRGEAATIRGQRVGNEKTGKGAKRTTQSSMEGRSNVQAQSGQLRVGEIRSLPTGLEIDGAGGRLHNGASSGDGSQGKADFDSDGMCTPSGSQAAKQRSEKSGTVAVQSEPQVSGTWENCGRCGKPIVCDGLGTALKPAMELICLARKPLSEKTVAANVLKWGTGAINIDGCRVESEKLTGWGGKAAGGNTWDETNNGLGKDGEARPVQGRFPANVITDGSDEVVAAFPSPHGAGSKRGGGLGKNEVKESAALGDKFNNPNNGTRFGDEGSAARFFYQAKANKTDRANSKHPTVKPIALMRYLARLITPPGGTILDPFAGSGTTGEAAYLEGFNCYLIEREAEYVADISARFAALAAPASGSAANDNDALGSQIDLEDAIARAA